MTRTVSRALQPLCTSTVLGKDWIPRLSVASFERMRDDMVRLPPVWDEGPSFGGQSRVQEGDLCQNIFKIFVASLSCSSSERMRDGSSYFLFNTKG